MIAIMTSKQLLKYIIYIYIYVDFSFLNAQHWYWIGTPYRLHEGKNGVGTSLLAVMNMEPAAPLCICIQAKQPCCEKNLFNFNVCSERVRR